MKIMDNKDLNKPLISVLINCYNGEKFLKDTLDSVINQTYLNWEIIFWDNQSTDNSKKIFQSYNDKRFKYFSSSKHEILGKARQLAFEEVKGEWLGILDCDDLWYPNRLEIQMKEIAKYHKQNIFPGIIYGRVLSIDEFGNNLGELNNNIFYRKKFPEGNVFKLLLLKGNFIINSSTLINVNYLKKSGGLPVNYKNASDYYLSCLISKDYPVYLVKEIISKYRIHQLNLTKNQKVLSYVEQLNIFKIFSKYLNISNSKKIKRINQINSIIYLSKFQRGEISLIDLFKFLALNKTYIYLFDFILRYYFNKLKR